MERLAVGKNEIDFFLEELPKKLACIETGLKDLETLRYRFSELRDEVSEFLKSVPKDTSGLSEEKKTELLGRLRQLNQKVSGIRNDMLVIVSTT